MCDICELRILIKVSNTYIKNVYLFSVDNSWIVILILIYTKGITDIKIKGVGTHLGYKWT